MDKKTESRKQKLAYFWTAATVVASIIIGAGVITHSAQVLPAVSGYSSNFIRSCMRGAVFDGNKERRTGR